MRILDLEDRRVAVWGFGKEGRASVRRIHSLLPRLHLTVLNDAPLPRDASAMISDAGHIRLISGKAVSAALKHFDVVIKSPGISLYREDIQAAKAQGVLFTSSTQLWFDENPFADTICITGTKGKSTTCALITHLLNASGLPALSAGNIGRPLIDMMTVSPAPRFWVIELSSYQISDLNAVPGIAVLLNLFPEHLDWHGSQATYFRDKLNLFSHPGQKTAVVNRIDPVTQSLFKPTPHTRYFNCRQRVHFDNAFIREGKQRADAHLRSQSLRCSQSIQYLRRFDRHAGCGHRP
jgi:UDP-N-acetylmuramoylalanine-D-glutamate ligase